MLGKGILKGLHERASKIKEQIESLEASGEISGV